jgi:ABC-type uncharacterized transport system auxiliary subunit
MASDLKSVEKLIPVPTNTDVLETLIEASNFLLRRSKAFYANAANLKKKERVEDSHVASVAAAHNKAGAQWLMELVESASSLH